MPKLVAPDELERIVLLIARHPAGISVEGVLRALGSAIKRRTLQRRLSVLVNRGSIVAAGTGRALKYRTAPVQGGLRASEPDSPDMLQATVEAYVPLSAAGAEVRAHVRLPRQQRQPVGYKLAFLEQYHPNGTAYLPDATRAQLHVLGRSSAERAPAGTFARDILDRLLIDLSWASSRLEGNTYSRLDTERLIELGQAAEGKDALETQMILNHRAAIEYLVREAAHVGANRETVIALHAFLSDGLLPDPLACGRIRNRPVEIGGSVYLPLAMPKRLEELFGIVIDMAAEIRDPFEQAFFLMVHLPYLQPFEDVNKRVSRLAANIPFIRHNLCPLSFIDVPERAYVDAMLGVYELTRVELLRDVFVWAYERSCQQYLAVKQQLVPPDLFRLRYRAELSDAVRAIVRGGMSADDGALCSVVPASMPECDREAFVVLLRTEFRTLHQGNAIRFGLRPLEFAAWAKKGGEA
jgi:hypothetical protein